MRFLKFALLGLAFAPAFAHDWGCWIQPNRTVYVRNTATYSSQAAAALNEWNGDTVLSIVNVSYHTEVSVYDGNYGNTGWGGLASIESYSGCNILHGHATLNYYYSYSSNGKRGVFCQEVGHLFGLQHSNDGGCMGGGYYYSIDSNYNVVSHNINDIASKYAGIGYKHDDPPGESDHHDHGNDVISGKPVVHALWYENPQSLSEAVGLANAIVLAKVVEIYDEPDIVVPITPNGDEVDRVPNQLIVLKTLRVLNGAMREETIPLFHTGNEDYILIGDPPYRMGETYLLFLTARDDSTYRVISPEGRYRVKDGSMTPMSEKPFAAVVASGSVDMLERDLRDRFVK